VNRKRPLEDNIESISNGASWRQDLLQAEKQEMRLQLPRENRNFTLFNAGKRSLCKGYTHLLHHHLVSNDSQVRDLIFIAVAIEEKPDITGLD
jgi:hypothetical protein